MRHPMTLRLPFAMVDVGFNIDQLLSRDPTLSRSQAWQRLERFALSGPERVFTRRLLLERRNMWLYRCNQRDFCGDFIVVDMSGGALAHRRAIALELKQGAPLKLAAGGVQMARVTEAVAEIAERDGVLDAQSMRQQVLGDPNAVLRWL
ncbi:MAG: hypothetical protein ACE366_20940 [Bradymonadia bacterium]